MALVNVSSRNYQILIAIPEEAEEDWLDVTAACLANGTYWSASHEPIGEDGIQRASGTLALGIPIGQETIYHPWENPDRWSVGNRVIVKVPNSAGVLTLAPLSGLYIGAPVLPASAGKYQLEIELVDKHTLSENFPEGAGTGTGAASPRTTAVTQQLQSVGVSFSGTVPGTNPKKIPDRNDNPVSRAGQMAIAGGGYLVEASGVSGFRGFALYNPTPLFTHTVGVDDAANFEPIQSSDRPTSEVEAIAEGEEEDDPFNPSNPDGSAGGPGNEDPDSNGETVTATYAAKETVAVGGGSEQIMTVQRREAWNWSGRTFTRTVVEYACRGLIIPEDIYTAIRENTPDSVTFTVPSPYLVIQSLYQQETSVYEAGSEGRLIKKTVTRREPRGKIFADYYKNNPVNLSTQSLPDFFGMPATPAETEETRYFYERQKYDSDNRGREGDDTGGQVRQIETVTAQLLGAIAGNATNITDYENALETPIIASSQRQYWIKRTAREWEQHTVSRSSGQGSTVETLCALTAGNHETIISSSGNAQPPSADRRRPDPDKARLRKTIRQTARLSAQQRGRYRFANDYLANKNEAQAAAEIQAALRQARQRGFRITGAIRDEWLNDYAPQSRIDLIWNGKKYLGITDLVTFTLAGNQAAVIAECMITAEVDLVSSQINPIASFIQQVQPAASAGFIIREYPYPLGALPTEAVETTAEGGFNIGETILMNSNNEYQITGSTPAETVCAFWEFEDTSWADSNGGDYTFTATGSPSTVSGVAGLAVRFDSSSEKLEQTIDVYNTPPDPSVPFGLSTATEIKLSGYCRFSNFAGFREFAQILAGTVPIIEVGVVSGPYLRVRSRGTGIVQTLISSVALSVDTWYEFTAVVKPDVELSITVDGTTDTASFTGQVESDEFGETVRLRGLNTTGNFDLDQIKVSKL